MTTEQQNEAKAFMDAIINRINDGEATCDDAKALLDILQVTQKQFNSQHVIIRNLSDRLKKELDKKSAALEQLQQIGYAKDHPVCKLLKNEES